MEKFYGYWLPVNVSTHGGEVDRILTVLHWFMGALFVGWGIYFVYCLFRFRQGANPKASYELIKGRVSKYVEAGVVVVEAILLVGLSMPLWAHFKHDFPPESKALVLRVVAEQFAWNIHYAGKDAKFGRTRPEFVTNVNLLGLDPDDPDGQDDLNSVNQMHVPVNTPVIVHLTSKDVVHSFKIPVMRLTQDAIPGTTSRIWFQATRTGQFDLACAQLCGLGHYRMRGTVSVDTPEQFNEWLQEEYAEAEEDESAF